MKRCPACGTMYDGAMCPTCAAAFAAKPTVPNADVPDLVLEAGQRFHGLEIVRVLGKGGMGVVYQARQPALDRHVAIKILPRKLALDPDFQDRFIREAKALASLSHPNIVTVHDFGAEGGVFFLVMEFVDGVTLRQAMAGGKLGPETALRIVPQLCDALEYAHQEGVVHRDIKPENIILDRKGRVKIADFGLAKLVGNETRLPALTQTNIVMGTPNYMAPEQIENPKSVDHRADIYSLGVVLYEMLTGELPLGRFKLPSQKVQLDVRLDEVVLKALEKEPDRRYQRASHVKDDITRVTTVRSIESQVPTVVTPVSVRKAGFPAWALVASLGILAAVAVVSLVITTRRTPRDAPSRPLEAEIRTLLPDAAADRKEGDSLTALLLRERSDLRVTDETKLRERVERPGRVSVLQPEYITHLAVTATGDAATGTCSFEAPGVFSGFVQFSARREAGGWTVVAFDLPKSGTRTEKQKDGRWVAVRSNLVERVYFTRDERPGRHNWYDRKFTLTENPFVAKTADEIQILVNFLTEQGIRNISRGDVKQAYVAVWWSVSMVALESPAAVRIERAARTEEFAWNRWVHRIGDFVVIAYATREVRLAFVDLVRRIQTKLGLPEEEPELSLEAVKFDDPPSGWSIPERFGSLPLPLTTSEPKQKELVLSGLRTLAPVDPAEVASVYCVAFRKGELPPAMHAVAIEFADRTRAARFASEAAKVRGWQGARRSEVLAAARIVVLFYLHSADVGAFEHWVRPLRDRMGVRSVTADSLLPEEGELPEGWKCGAVQTEVGEVLAGFPLAGVLPRDVKTARRMQLVPSGTILIFECETYTLRDKIRQALKNEPGTAEIINTFLAFVDGPPELMERLKKKWEAKMD